MAALDVSVEAVSPTRVEPSPEAGESPEAFAVRLSLAKAREVAERAPDAIVVGADTSVVIDDEIMGKPSGPAEAILMLNLLRSRTHRVITGVAAFDSASGRHLSTSASTDVIMRPYTDAEVAAYVASGGPFDKAGGYAVQDPSFDPAEEVRGCYLNVVGLPLCEVVSMLAQLVSPAALRPDWRVPDGCLECPLGQQREAVRR